MGSNLIPLFTNKCIESQLKNELISWVGTSYKHWEWKKNIGADCSLFIAKVLIDIGILDNFELKYQSRIWVKYGNEEILLNTFNSVMKSFLKKEYVCYEVINKDEQLIVGDFILYSINSRFTNHMSMVYDDIKIIESNNKHGVGLQTILNNIFKITHIYRIYLK